jgi:tRNA-dihydrouridine synthase B
MIDLRPLSPHFATGFAPIMIVPAARRLRIGPIELDSPFVQAALSGYSDWAMRSLARENGAPYTLCEVMLDQFLVDLKPRRKTRHFLHIGQTEHPVGGQLMGAEPEQFAAGARVLVEAGFDVIDINFGCPVKKVLGRCRGGFHLGQPVQALEIVQRTREAVPDSIPLTLKMRRGVDDTEASREHFFTILEGAFARGVSAVTVHARTVQQRYIGPSRWSFLREVKQFAGPRTILGSGDLFTPQACLDMIAQTGVDGVTIARGAIGNPWIFSQARALAAGNPLPSPPSLFEQREVLREHYARAESLYGPDRTPAVMRKFLAKYAALHPRHAEVRAELVRIRCRAEWERALGNWYAQDLPGCFPDPSIHQVQGERPHPHGNSDAAQVPDEVGE